MRGIDAFETFSAMRLHFMKKSYDGWKYGFKTKSVPQTYHKDLQMQYAYEGLSRSYPTLVERLKFFYPFFKKVGAFGKPLSIMMMRKYHNEFVKFTNRFSEESTLLCNLLKREVESYDQLLDCSGTFPKIYELVNDSIITYDQAVLAFMIFPDLNSTSSNEPFVFDNFKSDIEFDKKFFSLYIDPQSLLDAQAVAKDTLNGI